MTLLALKYRPQRFADLCGQDSARLILQAIVFGGELPPAFIFDGTRGSGKTSAARILAAALNCENSDNGDNCGQCDSCLEVRAGTSMAVHEIDAASNGGVEDIRALKDMVQFSSGSKWRVILLDEAHAMSKSAFNALLKLLEEPPAFTLFILLTTEPDKIIETVRSRSMPIHFNPVSNEAIVSRLKHICNQEEFTFEDSALTEIAELSGGGLRDAVMLLEQANRVEAHTLSQVRGLAGKTDLPHKIAQSVITQKYDTMVGQVREYFTVSGDIPGLISDLIEDFQIRFANNSISVQQLVASVKLLWDARAIPSTANRNSRIQMEAVLILLYGLFYVKPKDESNTPILRVDDKENSVVQTADDEISLDELTAIVEG